VTHQRSPATTGGYAPVLALAPALVLAPAQPPPWPRTGHQPRFDTPAPRPAPPGSSGRMLTWPTLSPVVVTGSSGPNFRAA